jgi:hypothetical protein
MRRAFRDYWLACLAIGAAIMANVVVLVIH